MAVIDDVSWNSIMILGMPGANMEDPWEEACQQLCRARDQRCHDLRPDLRVVCEMSVCEYEGRGEGMRARKSYVTSVIMEMVAILNHFLPDGQFFGFWGSSGPSQSTILGSRSASFAASSGFSAVSFAESGLIVAPSRSEAFGLSPFSMSTSLGAGSEGLGSAMLTELSDDAVRITEVANAYSRVSSVSRRLLVCLSAVLVVQV